MCSGGHDSYREFHATDGTIVNVGYTAFKGGLKGFCPRSSDCALTKMGCPCTGVKAGKFAPIHPKERSIQDVVTFLKLSPGKIIRGKRSKGSIPLIKYIEMKLKEMELV